MRRWPACSSQRIQPAQLEVSLATLEQIEEQARQVERQWQLRLERARYEADLARRRFLAVEPENRLVARNLEKDWNEKLAAVEQLEREQAALPAWAAPRLSPEERQRILGLAEDLPALWHAPTTTPAERKQLLRLLLKDVTLTKEATTIRVALRWQTGGVHDGGSTAAAAFLRCPPHGGGGGRSGPCRWPRTTRIANSPSN